MNALTVAWKLRVDMLAILAAATPRSSNRGSEPRRRAAKATPLVRHESAIQELLSQGLATELVDASGQVASGEVSRVEELAADIEETGVMPASQRRPGIEHERRHA